MPLESNSELKTSAKRRGRSSASDLLNSESSCTTSDKKKRKKSASKNVTLCENFQSHCNRPQKPKCNILSYLRDHEMNISYPKYKKPIKDAIIKYCRSLKIDKIESPFDRRVTFLVWHPTNPRLLAVTSHWGDIILYDHEKNIASASLIQGIGAGGSIQGMKFDPLNPVQIYTASMEGKLMVLNFHTKKFKIFLETNDINRWYISVDVNSFNNTMVAGDTKGSLSILTLQGEIISDQLQLHKKSFKISHAEFSKREPWLLCTSSTDSTMKLWDIRSLRQEKSGEVKPLHIIKHEKPINAAYFSLKNGSRLMTTDQCDKIFIYRAPLWGLETCIMHPHRQFQHLTPIKAYWHPLEDIVIVGRYPHSKFPGYHSNELRTIDFFDADDGEMLYKHYQTGCNGILSLNRFNITGEVLASSYGARFIIWKPHLKTIEHGYKDYLQDKSTKEDHYVDLCEKDWSTFLKKQSKNKATNRKKLKITTQIGSKNKTEKK